MMKAEILRGVAGFNQVESDWRHLASEVSDSPYYVQPAVVRAAIECLDADDSDLIIIRVEDTQGCAALLRVSMRPRRIFRIVPLRTLEVTRYPECPHQDVLMRPDVSAADVWTAIVRALRNAGLQWDALSCRSVPRWRGMHRFVAELGHRVRVVAGVGSSLAENRIDTTRHYSELAGAFSLPLQKSLAKGWRRIERMGRWEALSVRGAPDQLWAFDEFCRVEASGWKGSGGTGSAVGLSQRTLEYFRRLFLIDEGALCWGEINLLRVGGVSIAGQFCMNSGSTKSIIKVGYDEAYSRLGPGHLLLDEILRRSCANPSIEVVSRVSHQPWHSDWAVQPRPVDDVMVLRSDVLGMAWRAFAAVRASRTDKAP